MNFPGQSTTTALVVSASQASTVTSAAFDLLQYDGPALVIENHGAAALWAVGGQLDGLTTAALVECLPSLIAGRSVGTLGAVLKEIGRRGELTVTTRPAPFGPGDRIKS